jgi:hypothetical protein
VKLLIRYVLSLSEIFIFLFHSNFSLELNYLVDSKFILKVAKKRLGGIDK